MTAETWRCQFFTEWAAIFTSYFECIPGYMPRWMQIKQDSFEPTEGFGL